MGVAVRTPPRGTFLSRMPLGAVRVLEDGLAGTDPQAPGVAGPKDLALAFRDLRVARTGRAGRAGTRSRMYLLDDLVPPTGVPGQVRVADEGDLDLLMDWFLAFTREAGEPTPSDLRGGVNLTLRNGGLHLWTESGTPVAMAGFVGPAAGVARIGPVFTPQEHRRRGYGAAITAATCVAALERSLDVMLYTDLDHPWSNSMYQKIGFEAIGDVDEYLFG